MSSWECAVLSLHTDTLLVATTYFIHETSNQESVGQHWQIPLANFWLLFERISSTALVRGVWCVARVKNFQKSIRPAKNNAVGQKTDRFTRYALNKLPKHMCVIVKQAAACMLIACSTHKNEKARPRKFLYISGQGNSKPESFDTQEYACSFTQILMIMHLRTTGQGIWSSWSPQKL